MRQKYNNNVSIIDGQKYRSNKERKRHCELLLLEKAGKISDLKREVPYILVESYIYNGRKIPNLRYVADYVYNRDGIIVVEDCKGFKTQVYKIKRHLMATVHGITILET